MKPGQFSLAAAGLALAWSLAAHAAEPVSTPIATADGGSYVGATQDGRFHGKGRIDWTHGGFYEGAFADGLMHGKGKLRMPGGDVYEGDFVRGQGQGRARFELAQGMVYEGEVKGFQFHGKGRLVSPDGSVHEGMFEAGAPHGHGRSVSSKDTYEGEFRKGARHGQGRVRYSNGVTYRGEWRNDRFHGRGEYVHKEKGTYAGDFRDGVFAGHGVHTMPGGWRYEGEVANWLPKGLGRAVDAEGMTYEGRFQEQGMSGPGRITWKDGSRFVGDIQEYQPSGHGVLTRANGDAYRGAFTYGEFNGEGTLTYAKPVDGRKVDSGTWRFGRFAPREDEEQHRAAKAVEDALYAQPALLDAALSRIEPGRPGRIDMYLLAIAGDGSQEVFRREVDFVQRQFDADFDTRGRSVALVNSRNTVAQQPMASVTSVRKALGAIAAKMNRDEDILFVFMTSHGSSKHEFSLGLKGMDLPPLGAKELGAVLDASGIRWKVVVVSACYSGGFIAPLKNDGTLVITAARHDRTSFGCADEAEFTYFGRAYFKEALPKSASFQAAFKQAETLVHDWETRGAAPGDQAREGGGDADESPRRGRSRKKKDENSLPQMASAAPIDQQLERWWRQRKPRGGPRSGD